MEWRGASIDRGGRARTRGSRRRSGRKPDGRVVHELIPGGAGVEERARNRRAVEASERGCEAGAEAGNRIRANEIRGRRRERKGCAGRTVSADKLQLPRPNGSRGQQDKQ